MVKDDEQVIMIFITCHSSWRTEKTM